MKMLKDARVILLLVLTLSSLLLLSYPYIVKKSGAIVVSLDTVSKCTGVAVGGVISQASGGDVKNADDFQKLAGSMNTGSYMTMVIDGEPGGCTALADGNVGITVENAKSSQLKMSPDIQGGVKTTYSLAGSFTDKDMIHARNVLQQRIDYSNLQYTRADIENGNIVINTDSGENTENLISPCNLIGKITTVLSLQGGVGKVRIVNNSYDAQAYNGTIKINGSLYKENQTIVLDSVKVQFSNVTDSSAVETVYFLDNSDVVSAVAYGGVSQDPASRMFYFNVPIVPSQSSAAVLKGVAKGLGTGFSGGQLSLNGKMEFYLDGVLLSDLPVPYTLAIQPIQQMSVIGIGKSETSISTLREKTLMCLNSQPLNFSLKRESSLLIEASNGNLFLYATVASILVPIVVSSTAYLKSRSAKELGSAAMLAQIPVTLGAAAFTQLVFRVGWVIDLWAAFGILTSLIISMIGIRLAHGISKNKVLRHLDVVVFVIGFAALLTPFKGFGLALLAGVILKGIVFQPMFKTAG